MRCAELFAHQADVVLLKQAGMTFCGGWDLRIRLEPRPRSSERFFASSISMRI